MGNKLFKQTVRMGWRRALTFVLQWLEDFAERGSHTTPPRRVPSDGDRPKAVATRGIAPEEAIVVRWLLDNSNNPDVGRYRGISTQSLEVVGGCQCGCRSIDFAVDTAAADIIADALAVYPDGQEAGLLLWGRNGQLVSLEVYDNTPGASERLPQLSNLRTWEERGRELANEGSA